MLISFTNEKKNPQNLGVIKYTFLDSKYVQWINKRNNIWCFSMCQTLCYSLVSQWGQGRHGFLCLRHGDMLTLNGWIQGKPVNPTGAGWVNGLARVQVWVSSEGGRNWGTLTCRGNCRRFWKEVKERISDTVRSHCPLRWHHPPAIAFSKCLAVFKQWVFLPVDSRYHYCCLTTEGVESLSTSMPCPRPLKILIRELELKVTREGSAFLR